MQGLNHASSPLFLFYLILFILNNKICYNLDGGNFMKDSIVVKFVIWFISSLFALVCVEQIVYIISPYDTNIRSYGVMIIGLIIIFGLLILKKLDDLKHK